MYFRITKKKRPVAKAGRCNQKELTDVFVEIEAFWRRERKRSLQPKS